LRVYILYSGIKRNESPRYRVRIFGHRAFSVAALAVWNSLLEVVIVTIYLFN